MMNREFLEKLGLGKEQIDDIMKEYGKSINDLKEQVSEVDTLKAQIDDYKDQIEERDGQLEKLSKLTEDNEELTTTIEQLKEDNKTATEELQNKLDQQAFDFSLDKALSGAGVRNSKAVRALLDTESIKFDGEKLLGLDDQLEKIKETDDYLFQSNEPEGKDPQIVNPGNPKGSGQSTGNDPFKAHLERIQNE